MTKHTLGAVLLALCPTLCSMAGTGPRSLDPDSVAFGFEGVEHRVLPALDVEARLAVEAVEPSRHGEPYRVAFPVPASIDLDRDGTWRALPDGGSLWRVRVTSPGAAFLSFKLSVELPPGAELWLVSVDRDVRLGPFEELTRRPAGRLGTPIVPGDSVLLEVYLPDGRAPRGLAVESVSHGFRGFSAITRGGGPFECQRDINCPEGAPYQDVKRAMAEGYDGAFVCSGGLVDNTLRDNRYLYLTAEHCEFWIDPATLVFYWNYENSGCGTDDAPFPFSLGAVDLYHDATVDLDLFELQGTDLETSFDVYFTGWNRQTSAPTSAATIGFPSDKPKQVAITSSVVDCDPGGCFDGFGPQFWRVESWDVGVTEVGSSGSPLLDAENRVVGVLTGGVGDHCFNFGWDEFGKLHEGWTGLAPFLDPGGTGVSFLPGRDHDDSGLPPLADGVTGTAMLFGKGAGDTIDVVYDVTTCAGQRTAMLWGSLGDFTAFEGDVGPDCDLGREGSGSFDFPGTDAWFLLLWVDPSERAGHPGLASAGPRSLAAAGLCGVAGDDPADAVCD